PEFKESADWWKQIKKLFAMQIKKTVLPDGVQKERCIGYHTWCYTKFRDVLLLGRLNGTSLPEGFAKTVKLMGLYSQKISHPGRKSRPALGDGSGVSWWAKPKEKPPLKTQIKKTEKAENTKKKKTVKRIRPSGGFSSLWKFGIDTYKQGQKRRVGIPAYTSTELPFAGLFMMRTGWDAQDKFLLFDCVSRSSAGGHWHCSALNVDIYAYGRPLIVDPGMRSYSKSSYLDYFRRVRAHNIIEFASKENTQNPKLIRWLRSPGFCLAEGTVQAPVHAKMHRRVLFVGGDYWIVDDLADVPARHPIATRAYWHLNSRSVVVGGKQVDLSADGDGASRRRWMGGKDKDLSFYTNDPGIGNLLVIPDGGEKYLSLSLIADTPCGGHVACYRQDPTPPVKTKLRFTTLLYPFKGTNRPAVSFKDGVVKIGDDRVDSYLRKGKQTDGDCALVSRRSGKVERVLLVGGSNVKGVVRADGKVDFLIITRNGESIDVQLIGAAKGKRLELPGFAGVKKVTVNGKLCTLSEEKGIPVVAGPFEKIKPDQKNKKLFWITNDTTGGRKNGTHKKRKP
ncbi:MAG: heparinase II/III family protein, partial [Phycisphaerae bacterium]|nr:heparinase II/III family protein [Phycisphaerae bacterium]